MIVVLLAMIATLLQAQEKPVQLYRGMGAYTHPIAARNAEAQKYFDQGLVLLYGFNRYEAMRSFRKAAELDAKAIMPKWGLAAVLAPHINMDLDGDVDLKKGCEAAREASQLEGSDREKAYAKAATAMCDGDEAYRKALEQLHAKYPDDSDAATLYAESLMAPVRWRWWANGQPAGEMQKCIRVLEQVIRRDTEHPGANHLYVHAIEMSPNPEYALPSAQRLMGGIAPAAGHLVHMAGHIYMRVGDYEIVASSNERAVQVDEQYFQSSNVHGGYMGYYGHNLHFLTAARMMQGRYDDAMKAANKMVAAFQPMMEMMPGMLDPFVPTPLFVMLRFQKWDEVLKYPKPATDKLPVTQAIWHFSRAVAYQAKKDVPKAAEEQKAFEKQRAAIPADAMWINNKSANVLEIASESLQARMAAGAADAAAHWKKAAELQDALIYDEPPPWYYPVRESWGATLLRGGDAAAAERIFRDDLDRTPRNGRSLFGLWKALDAQGRREDAELVKAEFERAWKRGQVTLSLDNY